MKRGNQGLRELADRAGILAEYLDQTGTETRMTTDATRERLLAAMGIGSGSASEELAAGERFAAAGQIEPARCPSLTDRGVLDGGGRPRAFGVIANLYAVRSERNWGVGDLGDLARLAEMTGAWGGDFVGVNPLHAIRNSGHEISPYGPVSRLFRNPLYIAVDLVPDLVHSPEARSRIASIAFQAELARLRATERVEYDRVMALKRPVLQALHRAFVERVRVDDDRAKSYAAFRKRREPDLTSFATWSALDEHFRAQDLFDGWRSWPEEYHDRSSSAVAAFSTDHRDAIDFHRYLQFLLHEQLGAAAAAAEQAGLRIGLYQDLAIGAIGGGADEWMHRDLFVRGVALGAPPDEYARQGQNWGLPPVNPHALRASSFAYWRALLRSALTHAGAIRIDHVLGLFRQFWIPDGCPGSEGAYVKFPTDELLRILSEEAHRARALVVGEDLGTVPPEVPPTLERWGIYSSKVLYFEREPDGGFKPADSYAATALATADTHDMATITGFWRGLDIEVRRQVGLIDDEAAAEQRTRRVHERTALVERLRSAGALPREAGEPDEVALRGAIHRFLCGTPAELVGIALEDIVGEERPVNVPGVGVDAFPSWQRRLRPTLEEIAASPESRMALGCDARARPSGGTAR